MAKIYCGTVPMVRKIMLSRAFIDTLDKPQTKTDIQDIITKDKPRTYLYRGNLNNDEDFWAHANLQQQTDYTQGDFDGRQFTTLAITDMIMNLESETLDAHEFYSQHKKNFTISYLNEHKIPCCLSVESCLYPFNPNATKHTTEFVISHIEDCTNPDIHKRKCTVIMTDNLAEEKLASGQKLTDRCQDSLNQILDQIKLPELKEKIAPLFISNDTLNLRYFDFLIKTSVSLNPYKRVIKEHSIFIKAVGELISFTEKQNLGSAIQKKAELFIHQLIDEFTRYSTKDITHNKKYTFSNDCFKIITSRIKTLTQVEKYSTFIDSLFIRLLARENDIPFLNALKQLMLKANHLPKGSDAQRVAKILYSELKNSYLTYAKSTRNDDLTIEFKLKCNNAIEIATPELSKHRGWKKFFTQLANILIIITGAFIPLSIFSNFTFFQLETPATNSMQKVQNVKYALEKM